MTRLEVKVEVDPETDRIAVWKDGIGWVETGTGALLRAVLVAERERIVDVLGRVGPFESCGGWGCIDARGDDYALVLDIVNDTVRLK